MGTSPEPAQPIAAIARIEPIFRGLCAPQTALAWPNEEQVMAFRRAFPLVGFMLLGCATA
jgi:hypothetical protein